MIKEIKCCWDKFIWWMCPIKAGFICHYMLCNELENVCRKGDKMELEFDWKSAFAKDEKIIEKLKLEKAEAEADLINCCAINSDLEHKIIECDNRCYTCYMNHLGIQAVISYLKQRIKEFEEIPEADISKDYHDGCVDAFEEMYDMIKKDNGEPRKIEE